LSLAGNKNLICCYHCGLITSDWEELPSPFLQHSILSPTWAYVQHGKEMSVCDKDEKILSVLPLPTVGVGSAKTVC